jgi:pimeloyl-ACP methyl ester carboxylesterase
MMMVFETAMRRIGGVETELMTGGSGAPLIYLHAGNGLEEAVPLLTQLAGSFRVYAPSHPGFGVSELPDWIGSVDDLAYFYLDLLDELGLEDAVLVGASFGGWIAAEIAIRNTGRLSHLVLTAPLGAKFGDRESREIRDLFSMTDKELAACLYADSRAAPDYPTLSADLVTRLVRNRETFTLLGWSPTLFNPKLRQRLHRIDIPTLLLWGDADRVLRPSYPAGFAQAVRGARSQTIGGAGHYLHADRPAEIAAAILDFITATPHRKPGGPRGAEPILAARRTP